MTTDQVSTAATRPGQTRRGGPHHRISADNLSAAEDHLRTMALVIVPDDQKQRRAFELLMPHLYVLRNKGCSFEQITKLLSDVGFKLQPSTVRAYYSECLATRLDVCQARMNESIVLMAAIRSEVASAESTDVANRAKAILEAQRKTASHRLDSLLTGSTAGVTPSIAAKSSLAGDHSNHPETTAPSGISQAQKTSTAEQNGFGLLSAGPAAARDPTRPAGFFKLDDKVDKPPVSPVHGTESPSARSNSHPLATTSPTGSNPGNETKKVQPLQPGVPPLKRRDGVPSEVYEPGPMEHPAIAGLMLSLEARLYGAGLEYLDLDSGELFTETPEQKRFRITWRRQVPVTPTRTAGSFTEMDTSLFKRPDKA